MRKLYVRLAIDVSVMVFLGLGLILFNAIGIRTTEQGFFLNDPSIRHPFQSASVDYKFMTIVGLVFVGFWMFFVESLLSMFLPRSAKNVRLIPEARHVPLLMCVGRWLLLLHLQVNLGMGAAMTNLLTDIPKALIGRLRPYFYEACRPELHFNLTSIHSTFPVFVTKQNYTCTGKAEDEHEARLSFPSGHASMSTYLATYFLVYSYLRLGRLNPVRNILVAVTLASVLLVALICASRVTDYRHHPSDVFAGMLLGCSVALGSLLVLTDLPKHSPQMNCLTKVTYPKSNNALEDDADSTDLDSFQQRDSLPTVQVSPAGVTPVQRQRLPHTSS